MAYIAWREYFHCIDPDRGGFPRPPFSFSHAKASRPEKCAQKNRDTTCPGPFCQELWLELPAGANLIPDVLKASIRADLGIDAEAPAKTPDGGNTESCLAVDPAEAGEDTEVLAVRKLECVP